VRRTIKYPKTFNCFSLKSSTTPESETNYSINSKEDNKTWKANSI
jgi:hypothetical protein